MPTSSDILIRDFDESAENLRYRVYYRATPSRTIRVETAILTPGQPLGSPTGDPPSDGRADGSELTRFCELADEVVLLASDAAPYATITVNAGACAGSGGGTCDLLLLSLSYPTPTSLRVTYSTSAAGSVYIELLTDGSGGAATTGTFTLPVTPGMSDTVALTDQAGCIVTRAFTVPRFGCTDPDADNYDPLATTFDGSCTYSPRLALADALPALVANGRPVFVTLHSAAIPGATPAKASAYINLDALASASGVLLSVNGYQLVSGPLLGPEGFYHGPSLLEALQGIPALAGAYVIRQSGDEEVQLTAREEGTPGNLTITTSDAVKIVVTNTPGVNRYRSQGRAKWGCFVEVWCENPVYAPAGPVLAQRIELDYRPDNAYVFDIAPALRQFTGHAYPLADGSCPDRLCAYYLRFGELYAVGPSARRQRSVYQSAVAQALEAVEIMPAANDARLLSRRPSLRLVRGGPGVAFAALASTALPDPVKVQWVEFDGTLFTESPLTPLAAAAVMAVPVAAFVASAATVASAQLLLQNEPLPPITFVAPAPALAFANGQGGFDTFLFEGTREEITKRVAADYGTPTGTATRSATTPEAFRLNSGPLSRAEYLWLRRELGNSPAVWLETDSGPVPVRLTGVAFEADEVKSEYSLAVDCEPCEQPALGLTN